MGVTAATDPSTETAAVERGLVQQGPAERVFSVSVVVSGIRCVLAYVIFPWILPAAGIASGVGSGLGLAIGVVAIAFNLASIRRFQRADHRWKWPITFINAGVVLLLLILVVIDVRALSA